MHVVDDPAQRKAMLEGMEAWNSDFHFLYIDVNGTGLLPVEAENQGKIVITTELGGGGRVPAHVNRLAWSGLNNVLRHVGVLEGEVQTRASLGLPPAVILDGRNPATIVDLARGRDVGGDARARRPGRGRASPSAGSGSSTAPTGPPELLRAPLDGVVAVTKAIPATEQGDCVFVLGEPIDRADAPLDVSSSLAVGRLAHRARRPHLRQPAARTATTGSTSPAAASRSSARGCSRSPRTGSCSS